MRVDCILLYEQSMKVVGVAPFIVLTSGHKTIWVATRQSRPLVLLGVGFFGI